MPKILSKSAIILYLTAWLSIYAATGRLPQFNQDGQAELAQAIAHTLLHSGEEIPVDRLVELLGSNPELSEHLINELKRNGVTKFSLYGVPIGDEHGLRANSLITQADIPRSSISGEPNWAKIEAGSGEIMFMLKQQVDLNTMSQALGKDYSGDGYRAYISAIVHYGNENTIQILGLIEKTETGNEVAKSELMFGDMDNVGFNPEKYLDRKAELYTLN